MIAFIDDHRGVHGIEPICKVLPIAPSTYRSHVAKRADPTRLSARARRDATLKIEVRRIFEENFGVYGVRKVWRQLKREGCSICKVNMTISLAFLTTDGVKAAIDVQLLTGIGVLRVTDLPAEWSKQRQLLGLTE